MANKKISDYDPTTTLLDDDNILIDRPTDNNYYKMDGTSLKAMFGGDTSLKADRVDSGSQQMPLLQTGDGFVKTEVTEATPAWVQGTLSIIENNLTEPTFSACDFLYVQAGGYIWGFQLDEPREIPNGYTGVIAEKVTFTRIVDIETYEELAGHITLDNTIYGDYAAIQNANPIEAKFELNIQAFGEGSDAGTGISPLLTLDNNGLLNFNAMRVTGIAEGFNLTDAVNRNQLSQATGEIWSKLYNVEGRTNGIYNQPTILSTPENPPYNLTWVRIDNKPGHITAEVGDLVSFTLPNNGIVFNGEISEIKDTDLICSWTGYTALPLDDAGTWVERTVTVNGVVYEKSEVFTITTEYVPQFDGNGLNQTGSLGNYLSDDKVAQMSFVLNSIYRIGTKVVSKIVDPSEPMNSIVVLNRALTNTEGLSPDVWYCYITDTGERLTMSSITGSGDTYILTHDSNASDKVSITFLGENLPLVLPE